MSVNAPESTRVPTCYLHISAPVLQLEVRIQNPVERPLSKRQFMKSFSKQLPKLGRCRGCSIKYMVPEVGRVKMARALQDEVCAATRRWVL